MQTVHKVEAVGTVVRTPEQRFTPSGTAATRLSVAVNDYIYAGPDSENKFKKEATFYSIELYDKAATAICDRNLEPGDIVYFEGRPKVTQYTRTDGTIGIDIKVKNGQVKVIHQKKASGGFKDAPDEAHVDDGEDVPKQDVPSEALF